MARWLDETGTGLGVCSRPPPRAGLVEHDPRPGQVRLLAQDLEDPRQDVHGRRARHQLPAHREEGTRLALARESRLPADPQQGRHLADEEADGDDHEEIEPFPRIADRERVAAAGRTGSRRGGTRRPPRRGPRGDRPPGRRPRPPGCRPPMRWAPRATPSTTAMATVAPASARPPRSAVRTSSRRRMPATRQDYCAGSAPPPRGEPPRPKAPLTDCFRCRLPVKLARHQ